MATKIDRWLEDYITTNCKSRGYSIITKKRIFNVWNCKDKRYLAECLRERKPAKSHPKIVQTPVISRKVKFLIKTENQPTQNSIALKLKISSGTIINV